jgi:hypothetical protein
MCSSNVKNGLPIDASGPISYLQHEYVDSKSFYLHMNAHKYNIGIDIDIVESSPCPCARDFIYTIVYLVSN